MRLFDGWPYPATVAALFVIVMLRANATYWLGRAAQRGVRRTRAERLLHSAGFRRAETLLERWGPPVISLSFLTVGFQTVVNLAAGVLRMPMRRYLPAVVVGSVVWAFLYATVGFAAVAGVVALWRRSPGIAVGVGVLILGAVAAFVIKTVHDRDRGPVA